MALLTQHEVHDLIAALVGSGLDTVGNRGALFQFIHPAYVATFPVGAPPTRSSWATWAG